MTNTPSTEERVWAVLSHLSAVAPGVGLLLPVLGWSEQRRKSNYASFQCLQALGYQTLGYTIWLLSYLVLMIIFLVVWVAAVSIVEAGGGDGNSLMGPGMFAVILVIFLGGLFLFFTCPVIGAVSCAMGRDFRYPVMGDRLAQYLGYGIKMTDEPVWLIEDHEDRWVSAMGHISVIIALWGLLAPISAWVLQGKRYTFLLFQSAQTVVYQVLVNGLYMGAGMIYMSGFVIFLALTGFESEQPTTTGMIGLVALGLSMLVMMLILLIMPLLHILGQWAGYRVLKGDNYQYPLIGRVVKRWLDKRTPVEPAES